MQQVTLQRGRTTNEGAAIHIPCAAVRGYVHVTPDAVASYSGAERRQCSLLLTGLHTKSRIRRV